MTTIRRFYASPEAISDTEIIIIGKEVGHLSRVLRLKPGDVCEVFDGVGTLYRVTIEAVTRTEARTTIQEKVVSTPPHACEISLAQAIPQRRVADTIVEKATELGVYEFIPLITERTNNTFFKNKEAPVRLRWHELTIQAAKQSKNLFLPHITNPKSVADIVEMKSTYNALLVPSPGAALTLSACVATLSTQIEKPGKMRVLLVVGPEGGFSAEEKEVLKHAGASFCSLGATILKTDTAAVAALSIVKNCM